MASRLSGGRYPVFRTSSDFGTTGIIPEPGASPTRLARYDTATDSFIETAYSSTRSVAINNQGTRLGVTYLNSSVLDPNLTIFDQNLSRLSRIQLVDTQSVAAVFNPDTPNFIYALGENTIDEARLDTGAQTRSLSFTIPNGYYRKEHVLTISGDGIWVYTLLAGNDAPSKLLAVKVKPTSLPDNIPPVSAMQPLSVTQTHNWWLLSWSGTDDSSGIDRYIIEYRIGSNGTWENWAETRSTSTLFFDAIPGQQYYFRSIAIDRAGNVESASGYDTYTTAGSDTSGLHQVFLPIISRDYSGAMVSQLVGSR